MIKKTPAGNTGYTSCGFQSNLQVHRSLAKAVTVDSEVATNSRTLHTLNVRLLFLQCDSLSGYLKLL
jgi:hypothetical protein